MMPVVPSVAVLGTISSVNVPRRTSELAPPPDPCAPPELEPPELEPPELEPPELAAPPTPEDEPPVLELPPSSPSEEEQPLLRPAKAKRNRPAENLRRGSSEIMVFWLFSAARPTNA
jgi:hypothetical protein